MSLSIGMMTFPIYGKITNVPNHQPDMSYITSVDGIILWYVVDMIGQLRRGVIGRLLVKP